MSEPIDPTSADWLDGYRTAEAEYEAGHGSKDDECREWREAAQGLARELYEIRERQPAERPCPT